MAKTILTEELKKKIDGAEKFYLVDVLDEDSFNARHIPNSLNVPYDLYFAEKLSREVASNKNAEIVVYCASEQCESSELASEVLEKAGYTNVIRYTGGLAGWQKTGYEFESGKPRKAKTEG